MATKRFSSKFMPLSSMRYYDAGAGKAWNTEQICQRERARLGERFHYKKRHTNETLASIFAKQVALFKRNPALDDEYLAFLKASGFPAHFIDQANNPHKLATFVKADGKVDWPAAQAALGVTPSVTAYLSRKKEESDRAESVRAFIQSGASPRTLLILDWAEIAAYPNREQRDEIRYLANARAARDMSFDADKVLGVPLEYYQAEEDEYVDAAADELEDVAAYVELNRKRALLSYKQANADILKYEYSDWVPQWRDWMYGRFAVGDPMYQKRTLEHTYGFLKFSDRVPTYSVLVECIEEMNKTLAARYKLAEEPTEATKQDQAIQARIAALLGKETDAEASAAAEAAKTKKAKKGHGHGAAHDAPEAKVEKRVLQNTARDKTYAEMESYFFSLTPLSSAKDQPSGIQALWAGILGPKLGKFYPQVFAEIEAVKNGAAPGPYLKMVEEDVAEQLAARKQKAEKAAH